MELSLSIYARPTVPQEEKVTSHGRNRIYNAECTMIFTRGAETVDKRAARQKLGMNDLKQWNYYKQN